MSQSDWTIAEKRLVVATAVAPFIVSLAVAKVAGLYFDSDEISFLVVALAPVAYLTLIAFVLPCLWVLRKLQKEAIWSFSAVCGLSTTLPWLLLYAVLFGSSNPLKYGEATIFVAVLLFVPGVLAAAIGALIYLLFCQRETRVA